MQHGQASVRLKALLFACSQYTIWPQRSDSPMHTKSTRPPSVLHLPHLAVAESELGASPPRTGPSLRALHGAVP